MLQHSILMGTLPIRFGATAFVGADIIIAANSAENMATPLLSQALGGDLLMSFVSAATFATILAVVAGFIGGSIGTLVGARADQRKYWIEINIVITTRKSRRYELVTLSLTHTFYLFVKVLVP